jgi:3-hydroxybutyryl-CoA dehydrogenase
MNLNENSVLGVAGAGTMGTGIAQIAATYGHKVYVYDPFADQLERSCGNLKSILDRQVEKERLTGKQADVIFSNVNYVEQTSNFSECDMVIEAIIENREAKRDMFKRIEGIVQKECILATNTSSLSIASLSSALKKPGRFLGIHFFNPAPVMKLVEIIPSITTSGEVVNHVKKCMDMWDKTGVIATDTPGFIVNRVARPFYGEALRIYEEGIADHATIDWAMKEIGGFKMGPFELMDLIGHDVNFEVTQTVFKEFFYDPRFKPSFVQKRMVEAGFLGRKSGRGFYHYEDDSLNTEPDTDRKTGEEIVNRILAMLINEACDALFMNIATKEDIDLAMTQGVNYPKGLLKWGDDIGLDRVLDLMSNLQVQYREDRYRPNPLLKRMVREEKTFY